MYTSYRDLIWQLLRVHCIMIGTWGRYLGVPPSPIPPANGPNYCLVHPTWKKALRCQGRIPVCSPFPAVLPKVSAWSSCLCTCTYSITVWPIHTPLHVLPIPQSHQTRVANRSQWPSGPSEHEGQVLWCQWSSSRKANAASVWHAPAYRPRGQEHHVTLHRRCGRVRHWEGSEVDFCTILESVSCSCSVMFSTCTG